MKIERFKRHAETVTDPWRKMDITAKTVKIKKVQKIINLQTFIVTHTNAVMFINHIQ